MKGKYIDLNQNVVSKTGVQIVNVRTNSMQRSNRQCQRSTHTPPRITEWHYTMRYHERESDNPIKILQNTWAASCC